MLNDNRRCNLRWTRRNGGARMNALRSTRTASIDIIAPCPTLQCAFCFQTAHSAALCPPCQPLPICIHKSPQLIKKVLDNFNRARIKTFMHNLLGNRSTDRYMPDSTLAVLYTVITLRCAHYALGYKYRGMGLRISNPP